MSENLLEVRDLRVSFYTPAGEVKAVDGISYDLKENEVMGIVGESGSGKSVEAYSIMGLLSNPGKIIGGSVTFEGEDLLAYTDEQKRAFRGTKASMIFQNPMTCLNRDIQRCRRLIGDQELRMADQSHRDHGSLAHTARELMGILIHTAVRIVDADQLQHLDRAFVRLISRS